MDKALFNKLTESMQSFNTNQLFDIPTGSYLEFSDPLKGLAGQAVLHKGAPNIHLIAKLWAVLEEHKPNTVARYTVAYHLLRVIGYDVRWEDPSKCPEVFWMNTEGNCTEEAEVIHDILFRDYTLRPRIDISQLSGDTFYAKMKEMFNKGGEQIVFDSITQDSTHQS